MSKEDLEKNLPLPSLADVYGGVEDDRQTGGVLDQSEAIAPSASSSEPKAAGGASGSWFTKKRIIIIVIAVLVVIAAVGGAVGGVLGTKKSNNSPASSGDGQSSGSGDASPATSSPSRTSSSGSSQTSAGGSGSNNNNGATVSTIVSNPTATGQIIPVGMTAVAFSGVPAPSVSSTPLSINLGFPGVSPNFELNAASIVTNGDFTNNLTDWQDSDKCWGVEKWDGKYFSAWNGAHPSPSPCDLGQTMDRGDNTGKDTDYVVSFLYKNSDNEVSSIATTFTQALL
ncbi:hypothetical protein ABW20_dc0108019 [Dactylellina cionopaga]|nr:hypothetical protein ABW20_dc0108019 [Dactylellina cionopaga]